MLLTATDAWLFTTAKICLALLRDHSQLGSGWMGASGQEKKKNLHEDSGGAVCEGERPETASRLAGTPSTAEARRTVQPAAARGAQFARLSRRAGRGGHAWNGLCNSSSCRSRTVRTNPTPGPARPIHLDQKETLLGRSQGREGGIQAFGGSRQVFGGRGRSRTGEDEEGGAVLPL